MSGTSAWRYFQVWIIALALVGLTAMGVVTASASSPIRNASAELEDSSRASHAAAELVASRPAGLHAGPNDSFIQKSPLTSLGWHYVPYERTYRGLPVIGGDFVVVVDPAGKVSSVSVAQKAVIKGVGTRPELTRAGAEKVASRQLQPADKISESRLVIDATGGTARLAWEIAVAGKDVAGHNVAAIAVDAKTGRLLRIREGVWQGTGYGGLNGPSPYPVTETTVSDPNGFPLYYILAVPGGGFSCEKYSVYRGLNQALQWGNGDPTNMETACVDAQFGVVKENDMVRTWLGRNGVLGDGRTGFPISLDSGITSNAFFEYSFFSDGSVAVGREPNGQWDVNIDRIAHEYGHGIDHLTPGDLSNNGTSEFIADSFGTATEWFANEPAPYAMPDWRVWGRYSYNPQLKPGDQNCYSSLTPDAEEHAAAGVGNHWFYLLAQGSNPTNGPVSPTCNGLAVTGAVGVQKAIQVLYNAMLRKTSDSSYQSYRLWTLQAARDVFHDCSLTATIKAAWDAVGVTEIYGEPSYCVPNVVGDSQSTAYSKLFSAGLAGHASHVVSTAPVGTVVSQAPGAGEIVANVAAVDFWVSDGGVVVPYLYALTRSEASATLTSVGLCTGSVGSLTTDDADLNLRVVLQYTPAGTVVAPGTCISFATGIYKFSNQ